MKKEKFSLDVCGYDYELITDLSITKKEFKDQLKNLKKQVEETKDSECPVEHRFYQYDKGTYTLDLYVFVTATTDVFIKHFKCKDGYHFIK